MCKLPIALSLNAVKIKCVCRFAVRGTCVSLSQSSHTDWKVKDHRSEGGYGGKFAKLAKVLFDNIQVNES